MSDYPAGAENDTKAPYNQTDDFIGYCKHCDEEEIERILEETVLHDELLQAKEVALDKAGLCYNCLKEEQADMMEDDYKLGFI